LHQPARLALIHFGIVEGTEEVAEHVARARKTLAAWADRVRDGMTEEDFVAAAAADVSASEGLGADAYAHAAPLAQSFHGLARYWRKRSERGTTAADRAASR
jgi:hypothetical protein